MRAAVYNPLAKAITDIRRRKSPNFINMNGSPIAEILHAMEDALRLLGTEVMNGSSPDVVVLALPGPVDDAGIVRALPTVVGSSRRLSFAAHDMGRRLWPKAKTIVCNDVVATGYRFVAEGHSDFCVVAVGSGVGNKVFLDGRPVTGTNAAGGEIGHWRVEGFPYPAHCDCGGEGHLGAIASGRGAEKLARILLKMGEISLERSSASVNGMIDTTMLVDAFHRNDRWAHHVIALTAASLASALAALHSAIGMEKFFLVGGFAGALGEAYRTLLVHELSARCWDMGQRWDDFVTLREEREYNALTGAAALAFANL